MCLQAVFGVCYFVPRRTAQAGNTQQRPIIQTIPDQKSAEESGGDLDQCELNLCYLYLCMQGQPQAPSCGCQGPMIKFDKQNEQCAGCAVRRGALL